MYIVCVGACVYKLIIILLKIYIVIIYYILSLIGRLYIGKWIGDINKNNNKEIYIRQDWFIYKF